MASLNSISLIGRLGNDPETRALPDGTPVVNFSLAVNGRKKTDPTEWFRVAVFGKQAGPVAQYLAKGSEAFVRGRLSTRQYESKGEKRTSLEVSADEVVFIGGKSDGAGARSSNSGSAGRDEPPPHDDSDLPF